MLSKVKLYRGDIVIYYSKKGILRHNTVIKIDEKDFSESKLIFKVEWARELQSDQ